jgi:hypothetical protein
VDAAPVRTEGAEEEEDEADEEEEEKEEEAEKEELSRSGVSLTSPTVFASTSASLRLR